MSWAGWGQAPFLWPVWLPSVPRGHYHVPAAPNPKPFGTGMMPLVSHSVTQQTFPMRQKIMCHLSLVLLTAEARGIGIIIPIL